MGWGRKMSFPRRRETTILGVYLQAMKKKSINIKFQIRNISLLIILCLFLSILVNCGNSDQNTIPQNCDNKKIDSLIQQIVFIPEVYTPREGVDSKYRFLILKILKSNTDSLYGFSKVLFLVSEDSSKYKAGTVTVDSVNFNFDSTKVDVEVGYYILNGFRSSTIYVSYEWNKNLCNWSLTNKTEGIH